MQAGLSELPTEVLNAIFSHLVQRCIYVHYANQTEVRTQTRQRDLHALCLTNRRISEIAQQVLLEDVALDLGEGDRFEEDPDPPDRSKPCDCGNRVIRKRASLFLRSFLSDSRFLRLTRRMEVTLYKGYSMAHMAEYHDESGDSLFSREINLISSVLFALSSSSSLTSLRLMFTDWEYDHKFLNLDRYPPNHFGALQSLELRGNLGDDELAVPVNILRQWCTLPQLKSLTVTVDLYVCEAQGDVNVGPSNVKSLRVIDPSFTDHSEILLPSPEDLLKYFIPELHCLTTLDLPMVGCELTRLYNRPDDWNNAFPLTTPSQELQYYRTISPRRIGSCFTSFTHSLRHLSIVSAEPITFHYHDNSVLDLSAFRKLQKVRLSVYFFMSSHAWPRGPLYMLRENLTELLPASLQELEIVFNGEHGLFYGYFELCSVLERWRSLAGGQEEAEKVFNQMWCDEMKSHAFVYRRLRWITDLLAAQPLQLPELTRFLVREGSSPRFFVYSDLSKVFPLSVEGSRVDVQILQQTAGQCSASNLPEHCPLIVLRDVVSKNE